MRLHTASEFCVRWVIAQRVRKQGCRRQVSKDSSPSSRPAQSTIHSAGLTRRAGEIYQDPWRGTWQNPSRVLKLSSSSVLPIYPIQWYILHPYQGPQFLFCCSHVDVIPKTPPPIPLPESSCSERRPCNSILYAAALFPRAGEGVLYEDDRKPPWWVGWTVRSDGQPRRAGQFPAVITAGGRPASSSSSSSLGLCRRINYGGTVCSSIDSMSARRRGSWRRSPYSDYTFGTAGFACSCGGPDVAILGVFWFPGTGLGWFDACDPSFCALGPCGPGRAPGGNTGSLL